MKRYTVSISKPLAFSVKWWRILTCKLVLVIAFSPFMAQAQPVSLKAGIYEFTDITAREFYLLAPTVIAGYEFWNKYRLGLELSSGLSFNSIKYDDHRHYLYMVPLFVTVNYDLLNPESKVQPVIGAGFSLMGKADVNKSLEKTHYSFTYGYHAKGALHFLIREKLTFTIDLAYNFLFPPAVEDLDIAGLITTVGIKLPVSGKD